MSSPQVTLLLPLLNQIMSQTASGSAEMSQLDAQVEFAASGIQRDQVSASGSVITNRLQVWRDDWIQIKAELDDLNTRVFNMSQALQRGLDEAATTAQS